LPVFIAHCTENTEPGGEFFKSEDFVAFRDQRLMPFSSHMKTLNFSSTLDFADLRTEQLD
jgi:hypothetical protein